MPAPDAYLDLRRNAESNPDGIFSRSLEHTTTNQNALIAVTRIAAEMRELGVQPGDVIALDLPDELDVLFAVAAFHESVISTTLPSGIVTPPALAISWTFTAHPERPHAGRVVHVNAELLHRMERHSTNISPSTSTLEIARIVYSTATTTHPTAVAITASRLQQLMLALPEWSAAGQALTLAAPSTAEGTRAALLSIAADLPVLRTGTSAPSDQLRLIEAALVRHLTGTASQLAALVAAAASQPHRQPLRSVDTVTITQGVLSPTFAARLQNATDGCAITVRYGSAEAGIVASGEYAPEQPTRIGRVRADCMVEIVDDAGQPLPSGAHGHVRYRGPAMAWGYLSHADATARAFRDGWFYPGDRAQLSVDGVLTLGGRSDDGLRVGTARLDPLQLDLVALAHPGVLDACAFSSRAATGGDRISLAIVGEPQLDMQSLVGMLRTEFGAAAPTLVARLQAIPRDSDGSARRAELAARYAEV